VTTIHIEVNGKHWLLAFAVLIVMLLGSNYDIRREQEMNKALIYVLTQEIPRLQRDLKRCRNGYKNAKYQHDRLLGLLPVHEME